MEKFSSNAKVIDGTLVLTLPDAVRPVVWQMQLGQTKSSALEVREEKGLWVLYLKTPRMDVMEIAPFDTKEKAVKALMSVSRAMEKAQGQLSSYVGNPLYPVPAVIPSCQRFGWLYRLARGVLYAFLALILLLALAYGALRWTYSPGPTASNAALQSLPPEAAPTIQAAPVQAAPQDNTVGKPVSADDYLNNQ